VPAFFDTCRLVPCVLLAALLLPYGSHWLPGALVAAPALNLIVAAHHVVMAVLPGRGARFLYVLNITVIGILVLVLAMVIIPLMPIESGFEAVFVRWSWLLAMALWLGAVATTGMLHVAWARAASR